MVTAAERDSTLLTRRKEKSIGGVAERQDANGGSVEGILRTETILFAKIVMAQEEN